MCCPAVDGADTVVLVRAALFRLPLSINHAGAARRGFSLAGYGPIGRRENPGEASLHTSRAGALHYFLADGDCGYHRVDRNQCHARSNTGTY